MAEAAALQDAVRTFREKFGGQDPTIAVAAPGRVNLIGEHIDYCDGFVFPMAIEQCTVIVGRPNNSDTFNIVTASSLAGEDSTLHVPHDLASLAPEAGHHWGNYVKGVMFQLAASKPPACDMAIATSVPLGSGLSSSAALEVAVYSFLQAASTGRVENAPEKALACQKAEHTFAHVPCGIMDQFISTLAEKDHALLLDCKSMAVKQVPIVGDVSVVVTNSNVKHELVDGEYAKRRAACEEALAAIKSVNAAVQSWRDVRLEDLSLAKDKVSEEVYRRGLHVITEIERIQKACEAFEKHDLEEFGKIMYAGHESLKVNYNVTVPETDKIVEIASGVRGVYGSRMTGGGFGGCVVTLVRKNCVDKLIRQLQRSYPQGTSFATGPAAGARLLDLAAALEPPKPKRGRKSGGGAEAKRAKGDEPPAQSAAGDAATAPSTTHAAGAAGSAVNGDSAGTGAGASDGAGAASAAASGESA